MNLLLQPLGTDNGSSLGAPPTVVNPRSESPVHIGDPPLTIFVTTAPDRHRNDGTRRSKAVVKSICPRVAEKLLTRLPQQQCIFKVSCMSDPGQTGAPS